MIILTIITEYYLDAIYGVPHAHKECKSFIFNEAINKPDIFFQLYHLKTICQNTEQHLYTV